MYLKYKGTEIHYTVSGIGNAVVLLHGFTESLNIWEYFSQKISEQYRVICVDLPGHGKSGCIGDVHTMDAMAEVVKAVLDEVRIDTCTMIGHSMGGYVTLAFAEKYPKILKGFGLFHSSASADSEEAQINRSRAIEIIKKNHHGYLSSFIPELFTPENRIVYQHEIKTLVATANTMTKEGVIASQECMKIRPLCYHVLENSKVPVLIIAGHKDSRIPINKVMEQIALPRQAHVLLLREVAHMGYIEAKEETLNFLLSFLKGL
jgi:pimeloyl-ACP methyl ester carboxylesterase